MNLGYSDLTRRLRYYGSLILRLPSLFSLAANKLLPYNEYSSEFGVFLNKDGFLGLISLYSLQSGGNIVVEMVHLKVALEQSLRAIAVFLNDNEIPTKNGGTWQANTVSKVISNI